MSDLIKREDAIKAMEQRYQDILRIFKRKVKDGEKAVVLDMIGCVKSLPSADRPSESMGKLIERMEEYRDQQLLMSDYWYGINWAINTIRTADISDRPSGAWKEVVVDDDFPFTRRRFYCSACGGWQTYGRTDYCPNCGARMKDVTEGLESRTDLIWYGDKTDLIGDETGRHTGWFGKGADDED